ncbi:outer membrane protein with beta-barrel domain [Mariniflexile fucanivorans]|uniref:Outer membrane protein with beta-barrel domain n=1 Tax=Mariniflexile fucanivorans TaxID=264023 RepID=A0A4R1RNT4_9FLAO|nr:outer membrane beta-barrel protein [Mariniflexile fucanivorans]TCL67983.1 outer membrane protein with beta-barrel domain [Mariniflexile fucanivorans]
MKTHLIIALLLMSTFTFAQTSEEKFEISKNQWLVGGSINFTSQNYESQNESYDSNYKRTSFFIKPDIGYAIDSNLIIGVMPGFNIVNSKFVESDDEYKSNGLSIAPYIRKYFAINNKLAFNVQGELMYSYQKSKNIYSDSVTNTGSESDSNSIFIGVRPGLTYSLTNKIYLNAHLGSIGYYSDKSENDEGTISKSNNFNLNLSTSDLYFGVLVVL